MRSQRVQAIHRRQNPRPIGISSPRRPADTPIHPFFMMRCTIGTTDTGIAPVPESPPNDRVDFHLLEFLRRKLPGFRNDVLGTASLPMSCSKRPPATLPFRVRQAEFFRISMAYTRTRCRCSWVLWSFASMASASASIVRRCRCDISSA